VCERSKPALLKSVWKCELLEFDCLCRLAMRGLHYGQELVSTNRPDTFAQTKPPTTTILLAISRRTIQFPGPAFRAEGVGETDVPPPSAICRTRREMCIGTSSLVIECIGDSLTHRDYEPGYPPVRVAGFTATWNSVTSEVAGSSPSPRRIFQMIYGMIWQRTIRKAGSKLHPVCSQN
jgi:hypothetical protein